MLVCALVLHVHVGVVGGFSVFTYMGAQGGCAPLKVCVILTNKEERRQFCTSLHRISIYLFAVHSPGRVITLSLRSPNSSADTTAIILANCFGNYGIFPVHTIFIFVMKTPLRQIKCFQGEDAASLSKKTLLVLSQFSVPAPISVTSRCTSLHLHSPCCRLLALISITFPGECWSLPTVCCGASDRLLIQFSPRLGHQISSSSAC